MESPNNIYEHYYPVEDVNISNEAGNISKSDKYGYFDKFHAPYLQEE